MTMTMTVIGLPFLQFVSASPSPQWCKSLLCCDQWLRNVLSFQVLLTEGPSSDIFPSKFGPTKNQLPSRKLTSPPDVRHIWRWWFSQTSLSVGPMWSNSLGGYDSLPGRLDGDFALRVRGSGPDLQVGLQGCCFSSWGKRCLDPIGIHRDERYIDLHGWLIFMVNVGKYTSPMDPMGIKKHQATRTKCNELSNFYWNKYTKLTHTWSMHKVSWLNSFH